MSLSQLLPPLALSPPLVRPSPLRSRRRRLIRHQRAGDARPALDPLDRAARPLPRRAEAPPDGCCTWRGRRAAGPCGGGRRGDRAVSGRGCWRGDLAFDVDDRDERVRGACRVVALRRDSGRRGAKEEYAPRRRRAKLWRRWRRGRRARTLCGGRCGELGVEPADGREWPRRARRRRGGRISERTRGAEGAEPDFAGWCSEAEIRQRASRCWIVEA